MIGLCFNFATKSVVDRCYIFGYKILKLFAHLEGQNAIEDEDKSDAD